MSFKITKKSKISEARNGMLKTIHGSVKTPFFMPIATKGAIKGVLPQEAKESGAQIILSNTYHLLKEPGTKILGGFGGLRKFMNWNEPILTDSGGFQVFSLAKLSKISEEGVKFSQDGEMYFLTPQKTLKIQEAIGSDISMVLDWCAPYTKNRKKAKESATRTLLWAKESKKYIGKRKYFGKNQVFGIIQGGFFSDLRKKAVGDITDIGFDGYALGGLAVGEPPKETTKIIKEITPLLEVKKPRYIMGMGYPEQIVESVKYGADMFDCVLPTRNARHGQLFVFNRGKSLNEENFYKKETIKNIKRNKIDEPIDKECGCFTCRNFSVRYISHLYKIKDLLYFRLATIHNLYFYFELMKKIRYAIAKEKI